MNSVIEVAFGAAWDAPVFVQTGLIDKPIHGPREALRFLQYECLIRSGQAYRSALDANAAALRDSGKVPRSRETFIAAYADYQARISKYGHH